MQKKSFLFALPALIIYTILMIIPMFIVFAASFTKWDGISKKIKFNGISNYIRILSDERFLNSEITTLQITVITVLIINVTALILAILLNKAGGLTNVFRSIFFFPMLLSSVAISFIWNGILSYTGMLNIIIEALNLLPEPIDWFGGKTNAMAAICIVEIWRLLGFYMVIYLAALQSVPKDLYEACTIDGGNEYVKFTTITLPMIVPGITICTILSVMGGLKLFDTPMIMTEGGPGFDTETIVLNIFNRALRTGEFGYGSALSLVLFVLIIGISVIQLRISKKLEVEA